MVKNVIVSIKPKYVKEILMGAKKFEYRKQIFKQKVNNIYIYESFPTKKIVAYFKYVGSLIDTPENIWNITKDFGGIDKESFFKYFGNKEYAYAIKIHNIKIFQESIIQKN